MQRHHEYPLSRHLVLVYFKDIFLRSMVVSSHLYFPKGLLLEKIGQKVSEANVLQPQWTKHGQ